VTLSSNNLEIINKKIVQFENIGKASLVVEFKIASTVCAISNIHCPFGTDRNKAFDMLQKELEPYDSHVITGDMNSEKWELIKMLDSSKYKILDTKSSTRICKIQNKTKKGLKVTIKESTLDHFIVTKNLNTSTVTVLENSDFLSDHLMISTTVIFNNT
jgi:endonuclease/exonuclease/phosphatase family metal-dependent hydrolase